LAFYRDSSYPELIDLWQLVDEVMFVYEANARVRSVRLVAVKPDVTSPVEGCKGELRQVLSNLVVNAIEATPDGGSVEITSRTESERLLLSVWNSGPGIAPDHRLHIFEPFFTTKATGTGLGLWVSAELARKHGGDILLSTGEDGTTFTLVLPLKPDDISAGGTPRTVQR
jgi:signal transduction histidine kinase